MVQLVEKTKCTGCCACINACRRNAIKMETDETGFWFPKVDSNLCVDCGICANICPVQNINNHECAEPKAYIIQNKDDAIRYQSTSGGAFSALAEQILKLDGVVYGAAIDDDYCVSHIPVETKGNLNRFRSSKYVQSYIGYSYGDAEKELKKGRKVCFSGTPCQIAGLKQYLGTEYNNLLTVDVMCRAVPSPKVLNKYIDYQKQKYPGFDKISFRDKGKGYSYSGIALYKEDKVVYRGGSEIDPWLRLFLGGFCNREACHECFFQNGTRASDITLWDCWGTQNYAPEWDDNKGTTNAIAWTQKGKEYLDSCVDTIRIKEIGIENIDASLNRKSLPKAKCNRNEFFSDCEKLPSEDFIQKYAPITVAIRFKSMVRRILHALHIHDVVRKVVHKIRKHRG